MKSLLLCLFHVNGDEEDDEYRDSGGGNNDEHLHCASPCQNSHNIDWLAASRIFHFWYLKFEGAINKTPWKLVVKTLL